MEERRPWRIPRSAEVEFWDEWQKIRAGLLVAITMAIPQNASDRDEILDMFEFNISEVFFCIRNYTEGKLREDVKKKASVEKQDKSSTEGPSSHKNLEGSGSKELKSQGIQVGQDLDEPKPSAAAAPVEDIEERRPSVAPGQGVEETQPPPAPSCYPRVSTTKSSDKPPLAASQQRRRNGNTSEPEVVETQEERNTGSMPEERKSRRRSKRLAEKSRKQS